MEKMMNFSVNRTYHVEIIQQNVEKLLSGKM